jgi:alkylated DNA repair protein (DNA oxidative demethylase)
VAELAIMGFRILPERLDRAAQAALVAEVRGLAAAAPLRAYDTPFGRPMTVRMTAAGRVGWVSDRRGYRYADRHGSGAAWPAIPASLLALWDSVTGDPVPPDSCLVNWYGEGARMGLHRDDTEADFSHPVLSVSLGDAALFRMGGADRGDPTRSVWLNSGDVVVMGGAARLAHHGIDRIRFRSSTLLPDGGRINLTLRVAGA